MKKILVIGGTGTMGRPLVDTLYHRGYDMTVVCRRKVTDDRTSIKYFFGNAKDLVFIGKVLENKFDVIVDFCWYSSKEFAENYKTLLENTNQYVCLSSAAVYSDIPTPKDEHSPRYLETDPPQEGTGKYGWYCYEKARIEDMLINSGFQNWTIVRPGTTMNSNHFGWGHDWNENWVLRIMQGKKVIIPRDMLEYKFSLSSGEHVKLMLLSLIGNKKAIGEIYNVNSPETFSWGELLDLYKMIFSKYGLELRTKYVDSQEIIISNGNPIVEYWYKRARLLDRVFDSRKVYYLMDNIEFPPPMRQLIEKWVDDYISTSDKKISDKSLWHTAYMDRITGDITPIKYFYSFKSYQKYLMMRFVPKIYNFFFYRK